MAIESPVFVSVEVERGDSYTGEFRVYRGDEVVDLTEYDVVWALKEDVRDAAAVLVKQTSTYTLAVDETDPQVVYVYLSPEETLTLNPNVEYVWTLRVKRKSDGETGTPAKGILNVSREVLSVP